MPINSDDIIVEEAVQSNLEHKKRILQIFNENIEFFYLTKEPITYVEHSKWWKSAFIDEFIYIIKYKAEIHGYIRLTKNKTVSKEKHEISIALSDEVKKMGIGSIAYKKFERIIRKKNIKKIIAHTIYSNKIARDFFERNNFKKSMIKYSKNL